MNLPGYLIAEILALVVGIWQFKRLEERPFKVMVFFLAFIVAVESYGLFVGRSKGGAIGMVFNFSVPLEYMFFVWFLSAFLKNEWFLRFSYIYILSFSIFALVNNLWSDSSDFHGIYIRIGILGVLFMCCFYFIELLRRDEIVNPLKLPVFWVCCALFIFNIGEFIHGFGFSKLAENPKVWSSIFKTLNNNLNILLYTCISVSFLLFSWRK